jgi:hypothetical protein
MPKKYSPATEGKLSLAIQAYNLGQTKNLHTAARLYKVPYSSLYTRFHGTPSRRESQPATRKLTLIEEEVLVQRILELDAQGFPPRLSVVRQIADIILATRGDASPQTVGQNWVRNFINRHDTLRMKYNRKYDYQRSQCEDPILIQGWFDLVRNTMAKYGILNEDVYNFDETGFQMGVISTSKVVTCAGRKGRPKTVQPGNREWVTVVHGINAQGWAIPPLLILAAKLHQAAWYTDSDLPHDWAIAVSENGWTDDGIGFEWIQHFNKHTQSRTKGRYRLLILDGHGSHHTGQFSEYCKQNSIITLCMPPHASHLLQPLDVGCFGPLKASYGKEVEGQMRLGINHINKEEFLSVYYRAHIAAITVKNIQSGFRATGLVPYDPEQVLSVLNPVVRTPSPVCTEGSEWESKTPRNLSEVKRQAKHIRDQRRLRTNDSRSPTEGAFQQLLKGYEKVVHERAILQVENAALRVENTRQKQKRATRRTFIADGGTLSIQAGQDEVQNRAVEAQVRNEVQKSRTRKEYPEALPRASRKCSMCDTFGHDSRRCPSRQKTN